MGKLKNIWNRWRERRRRRAAESEAAYNDEMDLLRVAAFAFNSGRTIVGERDKNGNIAVSALPGGE